MKKHHNWNRKKTCEQKKRKEKKGNHCDFFEYREMKIEDGFEFHNS